jgi:hypothetical protein
MDSGISPVDLRIGPWTAIGTGHQSPMTEITGIAIEATTIGFQNIQRNRFERSEIEHFLSRSTAIPEFGIGANTVLQYQCVFAIPRVDSYAAK